MSARDVIKLNLRLPKSLHRRLQLRAKRDNVSLNTAIINQLSGKTDESFEERMMVRYMPWPDMGPHLTRLDTLPNMYADARTRAKPATVAVTAEEGGNWVPWAESELGNAPVRLRTVHSIKFADGSVWDTVNGWRDKS